MAIYARTDFDGDSPEFACRALDKSFLHKDVAY